MLNLFSIACDCDCVLFLCGLFRIFLQYSVFVRWFCTFFSALVALFCFGAVNSSKGVEMIVAVFFGFFPSWWFCFVFISMQFSPKHTHTGTHQHFIANVDVNRPFLSPFRCLCDVFACVFTLATDDQTN